MHGCCEYLGCKKSVYVEVILSVYLSVAMEKSESKTITLWTSMQK